MSRVGPGAPVYSVITIAQYALALHDACRQAESDSLAAKLPTQLEAILEPVKWRGPRRGFSVHRWNVKYRNLAAPWVLALSQGTLSLPDFAAMRCWGTGSCGKPPA